VTARYRARDLVAGLLRARASAGSHAPDDPVVVASLTRCGSTLLQRMLSSHPDLVIWGEHFGVLTQLRQAVATIDESGHALELGFAQRELLTADARADGDLSPHVNPFDAARFRSHVRMFALGLFRDGLPRRSRWGFKEVRYFEQDLEFLLTLFPETRVIVLVRRPQDQISSYVRAPWRTLPAEDDRERMSAIRTEVDAAARNWTTKYRQLQAFAERHPEKTLVVRYEDLGIDPTLADRLFEHCGLDAPPADALAAVTGRRMSSSDDSAGWSDADRQRLDRLIAEVEYPEGHAEVLDFFYPEGL
jgi:hypothetical protein